MPLTTGANGVAGWPNCLKLKSIIAERSHPLNSQTAISHHGTFTSLNATRTHRKTNSRQKSLLENNRAESLETPDYTCLVVAGMFVFVCCIYCVFLSSASSVWPLIFLSNYWTWDACQGTPRLPLIPSALRTVHLCLDLNAVFYLLSLSLITANYPQLLLLLPSIHSLQLYILKHVEKLFSFVSSSSSCRCSSRDQSIRPHSRGGGKKCVSELYVDSRDGD